MTTKNVFNISDVVLRCRYIKKLLNLPKFVLRTIIKLVICNQVYTVHIYSMVMTIIIQRQFIRRIDMAKVAIRAPYNGRCSYSAKQLVGEIGTRE